jgi:hypothetical protein
MRMVATRAKLFAVLALLSCAGCSTLPSGRGWGEDATPVPGWNRIAEAATNAAYDPWVWAPLVGAAVFQIDDWDRRTSDWAREHTPVFGSEQDARQWSDDLRNASTIVHYATVLATPSGDAPAEWLWNKAKGALVQVAAVSATANVTSQLKDASDRERPNGAALESFPSGHSSGSAVHTRLASRNLQSLDIAPSTRRAVDIGLYALTVGTSWARIEAGWHYPADTLVGMAIGNFFASFFNDAFLGGDSSALHVGLRTTEDGAMLIFETAIRP